MALESIKNLLEIEEPTTEDEEKLIKRYEEYEEPKAKRLEFRDLRADEVDVRVAMTKEKGLSLLLYKDARCDMNVLDETVGPFNWKRSHSRDNANCTVSLWDEEKKEWVSKEDTGTESNTEAEKGLASDSFKRACFNWGIGRELYTAPFIWIKEGLFESKYDKFEVKEMEVKDKKIVALAIYDKTTKRTVFTFGETKAKVEMPADIEVTAEGREQRRANIFGQQRRML